MTALSVVVGLIVSWIGVKIARRKGYLQFDKLDDLVTGKMKGLIMHQANEDVGEDVTEQALNDIHGGFDEDDGGGGGRTRGGGAGGEREFQEETLHPDVPHEPQDHHHLLPGTDRYTQTLQEPRLIIRTDRSNWIVSYWVKVVPSQLPIGLPHPL
jgi:hypothetical protein